MFNDLGIIFLAAGSSSRYGKNNKLLELYKNVPLFIHSIKTLSPLCQEKNITVVCKEENINMFSSLLKKYIPNKTFKLTTGGKERFNSVYNGILTLKHNNLKYLAIHDTARPLVRKILLENCYQSCLINGSGIAAKKISDTIKRTLENKQVIETVDRTNLWAIETPQVFRFEDIINAYTEIIKNNVFITDDAGAMEYIGKKVYLVDNPYPNKKVTFETDLNEFKQ